MARNALQKLTFEEALFKASALCSGSEHCISDIREKLYRWGVDKDDFDRIVDRLVDERYIDEGRYASAYVRDKYRFSHWGKVKIQAMLRQQRICSADIANAFEEIDDGEYQQILRDLIESKRKSIKDEDEYTVRGKLIRFALQRGFEMEEISKIIPLD